MKNYFHSFSVRWFCAIIFFSCISFCNWAQSFGSHKVALAPKLKPANSFNEEANRKIIREKHAKDFKNPEQLNDFVEYLLSSKKWFFESNYIYTNLPEANNYVREILFKVVPKRLFDTSLKVYIVRDPGFNASVLGDGSVFVNIGLLANINNEAELAAILGHEFGHYDANHFLKRYKEMVRLKAGAGGNSSLSGLMAMWGSAMRLSKKSVANEVESDNYAIKLMRENGFSPEALQNNFKFLKKLEEKHNAIKGASSQGFYFRTHPSSNERLKNVEAQFTKAELEGGRLFFHDSVAFGKIRFQAIDECINLYFEEKQYNNCIELAFKQLLFYPTDEYYLFYLVESLMRKTKQNSEFSEEYFITGRYDLKPLEGAEGIVRPKFINTLGKYPTGSEFQNTIFFRLRDPVFNLSKLEFNRIKNRELGSNDTLEFMTNEDALLYFKKKIPPACHVCNTVFNEEDGSPVIEVRPASDLEEKFTEMCKLKKTFDKDIKNFKDIYTMLYYVGSRSQIGPYGALNYDVENKLYKGYLNYIDHHLFDERMKSFKNIGPRDQTDLMNSCGYFMRNFKSSLKDEDGKLIQKVKFAEIDPEIIRLASVYKMSKLIFADIELQTDIYVGDSSDEEDKLIKCHLYIFCMDFADNRLKYIGTAIYLKANGDFNELYKKAIEGFKEFTE